MYKYLIVFVFFFSFLNASFPQLQEKRISKNVKGDNGMVVSARQEATAIGLQVLVDGGNAFDAAVAVHFALAVVYPQAGNIGGGGFMLATLPNGDKVALDFREKAPAGSTKNMYLDEEGNIVPDLSTLGRLASGVPGSVDGMETLHKKYGSLPWEILIRPAIALAENGFILTSLDAIELNKEKENIRKLNPYNSYLQKQGDFKTGDTIIQKDLAKTLTKIALEGKKGFYEGEIANLLVKEIQAGKGILTYEDLKNYQSVWRTPLQGSFYGYEVVTMPPPSSGGVALLQMLSMLEKLKMKKYKPMSPEFISLVTEVERLAYADRSQYLGDPDFYKVPVNSLLEPGYLEQRYKDVHPMQYRASSGIRPGTIGKKESEQTTHYSIVDKWGNAVAITTTINSRFGSRVFVTGAGFLLNNEMDDFSSKPGVPNQFGLLGNEANAIEPGKRMLSSMTPTIVLKKGKVVLVSGAPGGATIITSVLQNILYTLVYKKSLYEALNMPRFHHQWYPDVIYLEETFRGNPELVNALIKAGYPVEYREPIGRVDAILRKGSSWYGGGDPRGDDMAGGY